MLYCQLPMFRGADFLYKQFVRPWFVRHQGAIEAQFNRLAEVRTAITTVVGVDPLLLASRPPAVAGAEEAGEAAAEDDITSIFAAHGQALPSTAPSAAGAGGAVTPVGAGVGGSGKRD